MTVSSSDPTDAGPNADERLSLLTNWVEQHSTSPVQRIEPASSDASFRRYFRVVFRRGTAIAMDSPPEREALGRFVRLARVLRRAGLRAPRVHHFDAESGFALLSDLGATTYLGALEAAPARADSLYGDAIHRLVTLQIKLDASGLPAYDRALLERELGIFDEWLVEAHLGLSLSSGERSAWRAACNVLVASALEQPTVFVHRDYHSRNLMDGVPGDPGVLDFQDAVCGPITYDLVSLLRDCYFKLPDDALIRYRQWYLDLIAQTKLAPLVADTDQFARWFDLMGAQRHLKAAGIFARLHRRDGKSGYLADIPLTLSYITALDMPELADVADLIVTRILPALAVE